VVYIQVTEITGAVAVLTDAEGYRCAIECHEGVRLFIVRSGEGVSEVGW